MQRSAVRRPRNVGPFQAAAILYGDWGTSKAYVLGLAFALAGYSSFWLIAAVCILMALVGFNYITICQFSPFGGGVYASARRKSEVLSLIGAFFLIADYLITASLSALSCFAYLGVSHPIYWAMVSIFFIGMINYFGPRHSGNLALIILIIAVSVIVLLSLISLPFVGEAVKAIEPPHESFITNWTHFVGIIVALSGIESIANITGVMELDPGSTEENPSVYRTARKAIIIIMLEVCIFTAFLGFMMNGLPGLQLVEGQVVAPDGSFIRDVMLRYMGYFFSSYQWGTEWATIFGTVISIVIGILLLSAVNTALNALTSLLFVMSRDGELPSNFQKLTPFGVPIYPLILATLGCMLVLVFVQDVAHLADLYAVGFVGAIATNLGTNALNYKLPIEMKSRVLMLFTFVIMVVIEFSLLIDKPAARRFAISVMTVGLILRSFVREQRQKQWAAKKVKLKHASLYEEDTKVPLHYGAILCAVRSVGKTLNFALQEAQHYEQPLYILFVREQKVITEEDRMRIWLDDEEACRIFDYAKDSSHEMTIKFFYAVSDSPADTIVDMAKELRVSRVIMGRPRQSLMLQMLRGNIIQEISELLPPTMDLLVIS